MFIKLRLKLPKLLKADIKSDNFYTYSDSLIRQRPTAHENDTRLVVIKSRNFDADFFSIIIAVYRGTI